MADEIRNNQEATIPAPRAPGRRALPGPVLTITLLGVIAGAGLLICWLAASAFAAQANSAERAAADRLARLIAATAPDDLDGLARRLSTGNTDNWLRHVRIRDGEGNTLFDWPDPATPATPASFAEVAAIGRATRGERGEVEVRVAASDSSGAVRWFYGWAMVTIAASIAAGLVLYLRVRRDLRPLEAIQRNVESFAAGVERQFTALSLSDTLGQVARAWNHVVEHVAQMQAQIPQAEGEGLANNAKQRYESRSLRRLLDRIPLGVVRHDASHLVDFCNAAARRILHADADALGRPLDQVLAGLGDGAAVCHQLMSAPNRSLEHRHTVGGIEQTLRLLAVPIGDSTGETLILVEDVSHVQEAERARDNFLYHVTHELRTPLTNIQAYVETLSKPAFDDEATRRECYNVIMSETRRLSRLVEDILSISQLEVGTALVEMDELDLARLVRQMIQDNLGAADEKDIELSLKLPPKVPKIRGDKQRLSVLVNNLVGNAIKYTPRGGQVGVTLTLDESRVRIVVSDTGVGIAEQDQPHVFEKFYRAAATDIQAIPGTGLGLAIAREVARLHGGEIRLESAVGKGSTFTVELPLLRPDGVLR